jgi:hypothetical protein
MYPGNKCRDDLRTKCQMRHTSEALGGAVANMTIGLLRALTGLALLSVFNLPAGAADGATVATVEDIYILRSVREVRTQPAPEACAAARTKLSDPAWEDQYTFRSVTTEPASGRVSEAEATKVGTIRACFGKTADAEVLDLYGEAVINGIAAKAAGKCRTAKRDFPEKGVNLFGCLFELYDLPEGYAGGQLTTNSVSTSKLYGTVSELPGYAQVSIATVRLWRKR